MDALVKDVFKPSIQQTGVFKFVQSGSGSAVLIAVAGSGKSTTIMEALPFIPESEAVIILMFNARIKLDAEAKLDALRLRTGRAFRNVRVKTFHGMGFGAVCSRLGVAPRQINLDAKKLWKLAEQMWGEETQELYADFVTKLVSMGKGQGVGVLCEDTRFAWRQIIDHHDLQLESEDATYEHAIELAQELLKRSNQVAKENAFIDYDDQLYLPLLWKVRLFPQNWVIIDEAQDTNPVRRALARGALRPGGRLLAVGDPNQAIYGFTGASHDAIDLIQSDFRAVRLPLTVSYRCPKVAEPLARKVVSEFSVHESAPEGQVLRLKVKDALPLLNPTDAILCRNVAPLVGLAYNLIGRGIGCRVLGSEIGKGLVALVKRMRAKTIEDSAEGKMDGLRSKLAAYREREVANFMAKGEEHRAAGVDDRVTCISVFIDALDENERTVGKLIRKIESLFSDGSTKVLSLSTIHKAKGMEWDTVAVLSPQLSPSPYARQEWQYRQERNLEYVRDTRFKQTMIYLTDEGKER